MAQARFADLVRAQTAEAVAAGARALIDPAKFPADEGGTYLMPQILTGVDHSMRVMREESFGPVVGIMKVADDAEAVALMNDSDFGLTASLWTADPDRAAHIGDQIETGTVFMNRCDYLDPALCWTGCKQTGARRGAVGHRLSQPDPAEILSPAAMTAHRAEIANADATAEALIRPCNAPILCGALPPIHGGLPPRQDVERGARRHAGR
jgi:acyl-CoA reductase-like NAD-dependent aldehyde dehydrogenase